MKTEVSPWIFDPSWVLPGESMASLLLKFAHANVVGGATVNELMGIARIAQPLGKQLYMFHSPTLDWSRFALIAGLTAGGVKQALLGDVLEAMRWTPVVADRFRFCPECLRLGYHARYFQLLALQECTIHGVPLQDHCPHCGALAPFYGASLELLGYPYCCCHCDAYLAGSEGLPTLNSFFHPEMARTKLAQAWAPLDDWFRALPRADVDFTALREWVLADAGSRRAQRSAEALHLVSALRPLPQTYGWKQPYLRRKAFYFRDGFSKTRSGRFRGNYVEEAYLEVQGEIMRRLSPEKIEQLMNACRELSWGIVATCLSGEISIQELAFIFWLVVFENVTEPRVLAMGFGKQGVYLGDELLVVPWWNLSKRLWKIVFWSCYKSLAYDLETCPHEHLADVLKVHPIHQCCLLLSTDMRGRGMSAMIYPMPVGL